jgi:EAL domain-containing protein (putative c-di-GMP-specific phosphodiesterase class I)
MAITRRNNIDVICSRIETAEQREFAARAGCSMVQGFLMAKLVLLDEFLK